MFQYVRNNIVLMAAMRRVKISTMYAALSCVRFFPVLYPPDRKSHFEVRWVCKLVNFDYELIYNLPSTYPSFNDRYKSRDYNTNINEYNKCLTRLTH